EARVVEDRAHLVGLLAAARGEHHGDRHDDHEEDGDDDPHQGPGSTRLGSQSSGPRLPLSVYGAELSSVRWLAAPGQRLITPVSTPSMRWEGGIGVSTPPAGLSANEKALKIGWMRA